MEVKRRKKINQKASERPGVHTAEQGDASA